MLDDEKIKSALANLGFTRYESEVYNALVEIGEGSARDISNHCPVPREKIYYVLRRMEKQSVVKLVNKNPIRYVALPPKKTLKGKIERLKNQLERIEDASNLLEEKYNKGCSKIERRTLNFWEIFQNTEKTLKSIVKGCNTRLDALLSLKDSMMVSEDLYHLLKKMDKENVEINICAPLKEENIRSLGKLSNVANIMVVEEDVGTFSVFVVDGEMGYIVDDESGRGIHFIEPKISSLLIDFIEHIGRTAIHFDDVLTLLEYGEDPWRITRKIGKAPLFDLLSEGIGDLILEYTQGRKASTEVIGRLLTEKFSNIVDIGNLSISEAIEKIAAVGAMVDSFEVGIEFNEETGMLTYGLYDDDRGMTMRAVEMGVTYPPNMWSLVVQELIKRHGYREEISTIIFDKRDEKWSFHKKYRLMA